MPLKAIVDDVETLDEGVREFYVKDEESGVFRLDVEEVNGYTLENTEGLKSALTKERKAAKDYEKQIKTYKERYDGLDPDEARTAMQKLEELSQFDPQSEAEKIAQEKYETQRKRLETSLNKQWEAKIKNEYEPIAEKYKSVESQLRKELVHSAALKAIAEEDGDVDLLLPHVVGKMKFELSDNNEYKAFIADKDGEPVYNNKGLPMSTREFVSSLKTKFPGAFKSDAQSGGGSRSSNSDSKTSDSDNPIADGLMKLRQGESFYELG